MVKVSGSYKISKGIKKSFQIHMVFNIKTVIIMGFKSGKTIRKKILITLAPSTLAASSKDIGTPIIKDLNKKTVKGTPKPI